MNLSRRISRGHLMELFWLCAGQAVSLGLAVLTVKLLTSMGPSHFGLYALVLTLATLAVSLLYGPLEQGFVRFYFDYADQGKARPFIGLFCRCLLWCAAACAVAALIVATACWNMSNRVSLMFVLAATLFVILSSTSNVFNPLLNLLRRRRENAYLQILERLLVVLFLLASFRLTAKTVTTALVALCTATAFVAALKIFLFYRFLPKQDRSDIADQGRGDRDMFRVVRAFGAPFVIWGSAGWLQSNSERWLILTYLSAADLGVYAVMATIANFAITVPQGILTQFATPFIYERVSQAKGSSGLHEGRLYLRYVVFASAVLAGLVTLGAFLLGKEAILFLSNEQYTNFWYLLPALCLGTGLYHIGQALCLTGLSLNLPRRYMAPKIISGILAVILNVALVSLFGMVGIAIAIGLAGLAYLLFMVVANAGIREAAQAREVP